MCRVGVIRLSGPIDDRIGGTIVTYEVRWKAVVQYRCTTAPVILIPFTQADRLRRPDGAHSKTAAPSAAGLDIALLYVLEALS
jgi:hypothetical protein